MDRPDKFEVLNHLLIIGKTSIRKRFGTLCNLLDKLVPERVQTKLIFQIGKCRTAFIRFKAPIQWSLIVDGSDNKSGYTGDDIAMLNNFDKFYPWQKKVYDII